MENRIKSKNYILSTNDILAIKKLRNNQSNKIEGIAIIFRNATIIKIFDKNDIIAILEIFDQDFNNEQEL